MQIRRLCFVGTLLLQGLWIIEASAQTRPPREREMACQNPPPKGQLAPCANLSRKKWNATQISQVNLRWANLRAARLEKFRCIDSDFREADLRGVVGSFSVWSDCKLDGAQFQGAKLRSGHFLGSTMRGASLRGAFLYFASFKDADLRGADLTDAVVVGANFENARFDLETKLPFSKEEALKRKMRLDQ